MNTLLQVKEFMDKAHSITKSYKQETRDTIYIWDEDLNDFRLKLINDEFNELVESLGMVNKDGKYFKVSPANPREILDALCDIQYVLDGAFLAFGFTNIKEKAFNEVHRSNMSKLEDCTVREDGKILKGPKFSPPSLTKFLKEVSQ